MTFTATLEQQGVITKAGTIVDARFVEFPRQPNNQKENELIKKGEIPIKPKAKTKASTQARRKEKAFMGYWKEVYWLRPAQDPSESLN